MFNRNVIKGLLISAFLGLPLSYGTAQVVNPGVQQSGSVTPGNCTKWGPGIGQISDAGAACQSAAVSPANPTATAGPAAVNGVATTYMRSDAAPAVQEGSASQKGIVQVDGTTITATGGVISATASSLAPANPTATAGPAAVNGVASTYMRSDAAPAVQEGSDAQKGIVQVDGTTITATGGVISATAVVPNAANPTATAGPTAVNGVATTYMRSDAAPAVQEGSASQKGIVQVDGVTLKASSGVLSTTPGIVYSSSYGTVCDGTTNDGAAMETFLAAVAASPSKLGVVSGTSATSVCNMAGNAFQIRGGTTIMCSRGLTLKFNRASSLVIPYLATTQRTYQGKFQGCIVDGQNVIGSVGVDLYDASEWVIEDVYVFNVDTGFGLDGSIASYYNVLRGIRTNTTRAYAIYISAVANSNWIHGFRLSGLGGSYGIYCNGGNQNVFSGGSVGNSYVQGFAANADCTGSVLSGIRFEAGTQAISFAAGANYNTYGGIYCDGITSGTPISNGGTGNVKFGASNCTGW